MNRNTNKNDNNMTDFDRELNLNALESVAGGNTGSRKGEHEVHMRHNKAEALAKIREDRRKIYYSMVYNAMT